MLNPPKKFQNAEQVRAQRRFGVPYTVCGCPVTLPDSGVSRTFRGFKSRFSGSSGKRAATAPPEPKNPRPDLLTGTDDGSSNATHPSDHNGILVMKDDVIEAKRQRQDKRLGEILTTRQRDVERGRAGAWTEVQHHFGTREGEVGKSHFDQAFVHPAKPFWGVSPHEYGHYGYEGTLCGSGGGATVDGGGPLVSDVYMVSARPAELLQAITR